MREMIETDRNHPSIVIWSIGNEIYSFHDLSLIDNFITQMATVVKDLDTTRPIVCSGIAFRKDVQQPMEHPLIDVIDIHEYSGCFYGKLEDFEEIMTQLHETYPDRPVIIGEFGTFGIPGLRSTHNAYWSEDYQADLIERKIKWMMDKEWVIGAILVGFQDFRCAPAFHKERPHEFCNFGLFDEFRRPKLSAEVVSKLYPDWKQKARNAGSASQNT